MFEWVPIAEQKIFRDSQYFFAIVAANVAVAPQQSSRCSGSARYI